MSLVKFILIIAVMLIYSMQLLAQKIVRSNDDKDTYEYQGKLYSFSDMGDIFSTKNDPMQNYERAIYSKQKSRNYFITSLVGLGVGGLSILIDPRRDPDMSCDFFCVSTGVLIGGIIWSAVVPATAVAGLIKKLTYNSRKKKAVKFFNSNPEIEGVGSSGQWNLKVGGGQYGYGIVINF